MKRIGILILVLMSLGLFVGNYVVYAQESYGEYDESQGGSDPTSDAEGGGGMDPTGECGGYTSANCNAEGECSCDDGDDGGGGGSKGTPPACNTACEPNKYVCPDPGGKNCPGWIPQTNTEACGTEDLKCTQVPDPNAVNKGDTIYVCRLPAYPDSPTCEGPVSTSTPTPVPVPVCLDVKVYKDGVEVTDFSTIGRSDSIQIAVAGSNVSQGRIAVNGGAPKVTTSKNSAGEFYINYTVPSGGGTISIDAWVAK